MRIGFDAKRVFFNRSGLGVYGRSTVNLLSRHAPENSYTLFSTKHENPIGFDIPQGVEVIYPQGIQAKFPSLWRSYGMAESIRRSGVEIYHGLSHELPSDIGKAGVKSVVTMHDIIFVHHPELYKPVDRYIYTKKYKRSCHIADRIIAISEQTKADLVNEWNIESEKIDVVYQGCDPAFAVRVDSETKSRVRAKYALPESYVLSVGSIEERKNLLLTVRAMVEGKIDIQLVACGKHTPYADKIMEYAAANGVANRVHIRHNVSFDDLPAIYQIADTFVYASLFEGFGIPILEALNSRIPVITSAGGVFSETGANACLYINPFSVDEMVEALRRSLENSSLRADLEAKGVLHAAKFTEPIIASNLIKVYSSL